MRTTTADNWAPDIGLEREPTAQLDGSELEPSHPEQSVEFVDWRLASPAAPDVQMPTHEPTARWAASNDFYLINRGSELLLAGRPASPTAQFDRPSLAPILAELGDQLEDQRLTDLGLTILAREPAVDSRGTDEPKTLLTQLEATGSALRILDELGTIEYLRLGQDRVTVSCWHLPPIIGPGSFALRDVWTGTESTPPEGSTGYPPLGWSDPTEAKAPMPDADPTDASPDTGLVGEPHGTQPSGEASKESVPTHPEALNLGEFHLQALFLPTKDRPRLFATDRLSPADIEQIAQLVDQHRQDELTIAQLAEQLSRCRLELLADRAAKDGATPEGLAQIQEAEHALAKGWEKTFAYESERSRGETSYRLTDESGCIVEIVSWNEPIDPPELLEAPVETEFQNDSDPVGLSEAADIGDDLGSDDDGASHHEGSLTSQGIQMLPVILDTLTKSESILDSRLLVLTETSAGTVEVLSQPTADIDQRRQGLSEAKLPRMTEERFDGPGSVTGFGMPGLFDGADDQRERSSHQEGLGPGTNHDIRRSPPDNATRTLLELTTDDSLLATKRQELIEAVDDRLRVADDLISQRGTILRARTKVSTAELPLSLYLSVGAADIDHVQSLGDTGGNLELSHPGLEGWTDIRLSVIDNDRGRTSHFHPRDSSFRDHVEPVPAPTDNGSTDAADQPDQPTPPPLAIHLSQAPFQLDRSAASRTPVGHHEQHSIGVKESLLVQRSVAQEYRQPVSSLRSTNVSSVSAPAEQRTRTAEITEQRTESAMIGRVAASPAKEQSVSTQRKEADRPSTSPATMRRKTAAGVFQSRSSRERAEPGEPTERERFSALSLEESLVRSARPKRNTGFGTPWVHRLTSRSQTRSSNQSWSATSSQRVVRAPQVGSLERRSVEATFGARDTATAVAEEAIERLRRRASWTKSGYRYELIPHDRGPIEPDRIKPLRDLITHLGRTTSLLVEVEEASVTLTGSASGLEDRLRFAEAAAGAGVSLDQQLTYRYNLRRLT